MADRFSVSIAIGCTLAATRGSRLVDHSIDEGLSTQWDGQTFDAG